MKLILKASAGSTKISLEDAIKFLGKDAIESGEKRFVTEHYGPWQICTKVIGLAVTATWKDIGISYEVVDNYTLHGDRSLIKPKQSGYDMEGHVSIDGIKHSAFTSSILFELPNGKLINVAVLHCRTKNK